MKPTRSSYLAGLVVLMFASHPAFGQSTYGLSYSYLAEAGACIGGEGGGTGFTSPNIQASSAVSSGNTPRDTREVTARSPRPSRSRLFMGL